MSGFKEHFLDKYFAYRAKYVEHVREQAPNRARWAMASEIARLGFVFLGSGFCAATFGLLTAGAWERGSPWAPAFALCAATSGWFAAAALIGASQAARLLAREPRALSRKP
jgi:hypothetical protein